MDWRPGDILACYGRGLTAGVIRSMTCWPLDPWSTWNPPSHVGVICKHGQLDVLVESTTLCQHECLIQRAVVQGVQVHHPLERIADYVHSGGYVDVYRFHGLSELTKSESYALSYWLIDYFAKRLRARYDMRGALFSGVKTLKLLHALPDAELESIFCSELIAAVLMRLNMINHGNPTSYNPGRLVRELLKTGKVAKVKSIRSLPRLVVSDE